MSKRHSALLQRKKNGTGGGTLTAAVVLLAALACVLTQIPEPIDIAAVFAHDTPVTAAAVSVDAVTLPQWDWYLVIADGQAVTASPTLIEAEILRETYGKLAEIKVISTDTVDLRVTATQTQLEAVHQSANALSDTFSKLERMTHLSSENIYTAATNAKAELDTLCEKLDKALSGTENPVVRGLSGLVFSCREAMGDVANDPTNAQAHKKLVSLIYQYQSYYGYLTGDQST